MYWTLERKREGVGHNSWSWLLLDAPAPRPWTPGCSVPTPAPVQSPGRHHTLLAPRAAWEGDQAAVKCFWGSEETRKEELMPTLHSLQLLASRSPPVSPNSFLLWQDTGNRPTQTPQMGFSIPFTLFCLLISSKIKNYRKSGLSVLPLSLYQRWTSPHQFLLKNKIQINYI